MSVWPAVWRIILASLLGWIVLGVGSAWVMSIWAPGAVVAGALLGIAGTLAGCVIGLFWALRHE